MDPEQFLALIAFALATSLTPGPNNLMLMSSGANFGVRRTLPHLLGVFAGFMFMVALIGAGVGRLLSTHEGLWTLMRLAAGIYVAWLALKIAASGPAASGAAATRPLTFGQAALFQWVNPKAWAMALTAVAAYAPDQGLVSALLVALVFGAVNLPSVSVWMVAGVHLRRWLSSPARVRGFNLTMAALLVMSVVPMLLPS